jgi:hypothetical protein
MGTAGNATHREPWNKGKIVSQKAPFKLKDIWARRQVAYCPCKAAHPNR